MTIAQQRYTSIYIDVRMGCRAAAADSPLSINQLLTELVTRLQAH